jgi:hypothetical protein
MDLRTELIEFLDGIREYVRESGTNIAHDERESSEFVDIHLQSKLRLDAVSEPLIKMPCSFSGVMSENCTKCGMPEYMHIL